MSRTTLTLNGKKIPLPPDAEIAINYKSKDIRNVATASGSYAESFTLPDTNLTRQALGNSQYVTSGTDTPYRLLTASIEIDGNPVLTGTAAHNEVNDGFALDINGQNANLFSQIKGRNLQDLDLSDLDHAWTNANVATANSHDPARGYLYPLINYGKLTNRLLYNGNTRFDELYPAVYARTILERIAAPFTLAGSLLNDPKFSRLVVPFANEDFFYRASYTPYWTATAENTVQQHVQDLTKMLFPSVLQDAESRFVNSVYTVLIPGDYDVTLRILLDVDLIPRDDGTPGEAEIQIHRTRPGVGISEILGIAQLSHGINQVIELAASDLGAVPGDVLEVYFNSNIYSSAEIKPGSTFTVALGRRIYAPGQVHLETNLPDVSQEDFFLTICNMFNVVIQTDTVRGIVHLDSLERMRYTPAVDWSKKIDWNTKPAFRFALDKYGQQNYISYAESDSEATDFRGNPLVESIVLPVDNEQLSLEEELYSSPFTITQTQPAYRGGALLPFIPLYSQNVANYSIYSPNTDYVAEDFVYYGGEYWKAETDSTNILPGSSSTYWVRALESDVFSRTEATPRLLLVESRPNTAPLYVGTDYNPANNSPLYVQGNFEGLMGEVLKAEYHSITVAMLTQTRLMSLNVRLRLPDISALDFLQPVMLNIPAKNLQGMFYLNAVNQFRPDRYESTEVELVRLYGFPLIAATGVTHLEFTEEFSSEFN